MGGNFYKVIELIKWYQRDRQADILFISLPTEIVRAFNENK